MNFGLGGGKLVDCVAVKTIARGRVQERYSRTKHLGHINFTSNYIKSHLVFIHVGKLSQFGV